MHPIFGAASQMLFAPIIHLGLHNQRAKFNGKKVEENIAELRE